VPASVVITEPFQGLVQSFAATLGLPAYHAVVVPHPVASRTLDELRATAERAPAVARRQLLG
jgi:hypothetical protein